MWFDRLNQIKLLELPNSIEPSRYQWVGNFNHNLNGHTEISKDGLLLCDGSERCQLNEKNHSFIVPIKSEIDLFNRSIEMIGEEAIDSCSSTLSPMLPAVVIDSESKLLPFEELLLEVLDRGHLHQISIRPRIDIRYDDEVVDIARAKRLGKGALVHLASHSEDWQRQTLSGVVPKKVLARFSEDDHNIYENRIYARLLDKIDEHLKRRLSSLKSLQVTLDHAKEFYQSENIDYRLANEICRLWGITFSESSTSKASELLDEVLTSLQFLHKSIRGLKQSGLYLLISRNTKVGNTLYRTNILNHDPHYRNLLILWEQLNKVSLKVSPKEQFEHNEILANAYSNYVGLVLKHALQPYLNHENEKEWAGRTIKLQKNNLEWELLSELDNGLENEILFTLIPWLAYVPKPENLIKIPQNIFIAWPGLEQNIKEAAYHENWIPVSPLDMYCIERLGLLVDKIMCGKVISNFSKPITKIPKQSLALSRSLSHIAVDSESYQVEVQGEVLKEDLDKLQSTLMRENASSQAYDLILRSEEILFLIKCPVCNSRTKLYFQETGFKINCNNCKTGRYLRKEREFYEFEQVYMNLSEKNDFFKYGRNSYSFKYIDNGLYF